MELIERYLQAVKFWLPKQQKDDIIAELSDDIHAQIEEREAGLGRPLNQPELEDLLRKRGSPIMVANRFLPQQSLIGPLLFPIYRLIAKYALLSFGTLWVLSTIGFLIFNPAYAAGLARPWWFVAMRSLSGGLWSTAFMWLATLTLLFAILERVQASTCFLEAWNPRKLPPVRNPNLIKRADSSAELAASLIFVTLWAAYFSTTEVHFGPSLRVYLTPQWLWYFWAYVLIASINATSAGMNLMHPWWTPRRAAMRLLNTVMGSAAFCWVLKAHVLAGIASDGLAQSTAMQITQAINHWMDVFFPWAVAVGLIVAATDIYRILRVRSPKQPSAIA